MAYYNGNAATEPVTATYCDDCAEGSTGAPSLVPFEWRPVPRDPEEPADRWQLHPWRWAPHWGGPCDACGDRC